MCKGVVFLLVGVRGQGEGGIGGGASWSVGDESVLDSWCYLKWIVDRLNIMFLYLLIYK